MKYSIEIYVDGHEYPEFADEAATPLPEPAAGGTIHPAWRMSDRLDYYPGDKLTVDRVEHIYWAGNVKTMIFTSERPGPQSPSGPGGC